MAKIEIAPEAARQLERLPLTMRARMENLMVRLTKWPEASGAKPLTGALAGRFRMRTGDYRLQFRVKGETVIVEKVGHRDGFYEE